MLIQKLWAKPRPSGGPNYVYLIIDGDQVIDVYDSGCVHLAQVRQDYPGLEWLPCVETTKSALNKWRRTALPMIFDRGTGLC